MPEDTIENINKINENKIEFEQSLKNPDKISEEFRKKLENDPEKLKIFLSKLFNITETESKKLKESLSSKPFPTDQSKKVKELNKAVATIIADLAINPEIASKLAKNEEVLDNLNLISTNSDEITTLYMVSSAFRDINYAHNQVLDKDKKPDEKYDLEKETLGKIKNNIAKKLEDINNTFRQNYKFQYDFRVSPIECMQYEKGEMTFENFDDRKKDIISTIKKDWEGGREQYIGSTQRMLNQIEANMNFPKAKIASSSIVQRLASNNKSTKERPASVINQGR